MSHLAVRIIADRLAGDALGVNDVAPQLPRDVDGTTPDPAPAPAFVYDETRDAWLARGALPHPKSAGNQVQYPAILVRLHDASWDDAGIPKPTAEGSAIVTGTVTVSIQIVARADDLEQATSQQMYLTRAVRVALGLLFAAPNAARERAGTQLLPATALAHGKPNDLPSDLISLEQLLVTCPVVETALLPELLA